MKIKRVFIIVFSILFSAVASNLYGCLADQNADAEVLYTKINEFISEHKYVDPEEFDDVCKEFMSEKIPEANLLNERNFEEQSKGNVILYRGVPDKKYADELKQGKMFLSCWGLRGSGIYTTTSLDCASSYSDPENPNDTIVKMFIPKDKVRILNDDYLTVLRKKIIENHGEEFGEFEFKDKVYEKRYDYIFDSAAEYLNKAMYDMMKKATEMGLSNEETFKFFAESMKEIEKDPICRKRKKYFTSNKAYVWFNSGLLTKLMGYDVLYTSDSLRESSSDKEEEYLIVNPSIVNVLAE